MQSTVSLPLFQRAISAALLVMALCAGSVCPGQSSTASTGKGSQNAYPEVRPPRVHQRSTGSPDLATQHKGLQSQALVFIENRGQFDSRVLFLAKSNGANLWLTRDGIVFDLQRPMGPALGKGDAPPVVATPGSLGKPVRADQPKMERLVFEQKFAGVNRSTVIEARDPQPGIYNYFLGPDPASWRTHVAAYQEVIYRDIWKGIDLRLSANGSDLEEEFVVHPGASPHAINIVYEGIEKLNVASDGSLSVGTKFGELIESEPLVSEVGKTGTVPVSGKFEAKGNTYTFKVGKYNQSADLVIDPTISLPEKTSKRMPAQGGLLYSTYLGGDGGVHCCSYVTEYGTGIAVDAQGDAYVVGKTGSDDFPVTPGAYESTYDAAFVTKFTALGNSLVYSTYFPADSLTGVAVSASGNAYLTGVSQGGVPTTPNALQQDVYGAFLTVLSAAGDALVYSTGFGHQGIGSALAVDVSGRAYLTGQTSGFCGGTIPTTSNAFQTSFSDCRTAFIGVLDPAQSGAASLVYGSYLGGNNPNSADEGRGVAVDAYGMTYIVGGTSSEDFPTTPGAFQTAFAGGENDAFVAKFNPYATSGPGSLIYSTLLGGGDWDFAYSVAVDSLGNAVVGGTTNSGKNPAFTQFPTTPGSLIPVWGSGWGDWSGFVTKLNAAGNQQVFSTYWGGENAAINGVAVDAFGHVYDTGETDGLLMVTPDAAQPSFGGRNFGVEEGDGDALASKFDVDGTLLYSSYLGGAYGEKGTAIAVDAVGDLYVTGYTLSSDFPVTPHAFQAQINPGGIYPDDAFITKFPLGTGTISISEILPNAGGNAGQVTGEIVGIGFHDGATAQLACGQINIPGQNVTVTAGGQVVNATFDLTTTAPGVCDVVVTDPDLSSARLAHSFTVDQGGVANIQITKTGTLAAKGDGGEGLPLPITYTIIVTNLGNIDSKGSLISDILDSHSTLSYADPPTSGVPPAVLWNAFPISPFEARRFVYTVLVNPITQVGTTLGDYGCWIDPLNITALTACIVQADQLGGQACNQPIAECTQAGQTCIEGWQEGGLLTGECIHEAADCVWDSVDCLGALASYVPQCFQDEAGGCASYFQQLIAGAFDPNYLSGVLGVGAEQWVSGRSGLPYIIGFGNDPIAGTAAQQVIVAQPIDPGIDATTLSLTFATVPNLSNPQIVISIPPGSFNPAAGIDEFMTNVDLRPIQSLFVTLDAKLNTTTSTITWSFNSIDPATGLPPTNPQIGMLPPGANAAVAFAGKPRQGLTTGTRISDQASVIFNTNQPVNTNTWVNTIDNTAPTSQVQPLPGGELCQNFNVQWLGTDIGSGIGSFTIYVSDNGGQFTPWLTDTTSTSGTYNGQIGHTYGFYSIALDLVGNMEVSKSQAEATTHVIKDTGCGPIPPTAVGTRHRN